MGFRLMVLVRAGFEFGFMDGDDAEVGWGLVCGVGRSTRGEHTVCIRPVDRFDVSMLEESSR